VNSQTGFTNVNFKTTALGLRADLAILILTPGASAFRGWSPVPASNATTPSVYLTERQRVGTDEGFRLAKTQMVDVGAASLNAPSRVPPMTDIILHHYDISPYSEKVRLGLGLKGLAWAAVELPVIMPKPNLTALTGGYRKTPVLQIGADIYCDSQLIMRELERRYPTPSFYPAGHGAADALAWWAEKTTFSPAAGILFAKRPDALPEGFLEDRAKFSGRNIDPVAMMAAVPNLLDQLRAHFDWLDQMLADGRSFLQGPAAGLADLAAYHPVWFLRRNFGSAAAPLDGFPRLLTWVERVAAIGHGRRSQMSAEQALDVARDATSIARATVDPQDPIGRKPGQTVTVTPDDTGRDPVVGELVASDVHEIVIRRSDREIGEVCVHFPRAGFVVASA
jgi:glutathione S-transferase